MDQNIRYVVYCRKSTDEKNKQLLSIESQRAELQKLILREGLTVVGEPLEEKQSAKKVGRPVFKQMLGLIDRGLADGIVVWKTDRLSRNSVDTAEILSRLESGALRQIRTLERTYNSKDNVILLYVEFGMADQYKRDLSSSVKVGMRTKIRMGWCPGKVPVGYMNHRAGEGASSIVITDPIRFPIIKKCWQRLLERRYSIQRIYELAIEDGLIQDNGRRFDRSSFYHIFQNPFYTGNFLYRMDGSTELYKGQHEPMITMEEFERAKVILHSDQVPRRHNRDITYRGVFKCANCGSLMSGYQRVRHQKNGNIHKWVYYKCSRGRDCKCREPQISEAMIETEIIRLLSEMEIPPQFHKWAMEWMRGEAQRLAGYTEDLRKSRLKALDIVKAKIENLLDLLLSHAVSREVYERKLIELRKEQEQLEKLISAEEKQVDGFIMEADKVFSFAELAKARFIDGDMEEKRYAALMLSSNLFVSGRKPVFTLFPVFAALKKIAPRVRELSTIIEPVDGFDFARVYTDKLGGNPEWWAVQDSNL